MPFAAGEPADLHPCARGWRPYHLVTGDEVVALFPGLDEHKQTGRFDAPRLTLKSLAATVLLAA